MQNKTNKQPKKKKKKKKEKKKKKKKQKKKKKKKKKSNGFQKLSLYTICWQISHTRKDEKCHNPVIFNHS